MSTFVITPPEVVALEVYGNGGQFPVRRIYCVGRNYAEHAREMGDSGREPPFFFSKPADTLFPVRNGEIGSLHYPSQTSDFHHEVELVAALGQGGVNLTPEQAQQAIWGYAIGLDMTRRDLQAAAKAKGRPWEPGKAFEQSAPIGPIHPASRTGSLQAGSITLEVNGEVRQKGDLSDMIWSPAECIAHLSTLFELKAGDLIFTGTPAGVGAVTVGDVLIAAIAGLGELRLRITNPA